MKINEGDVIVNVGKSLGTTTIIVVVVQQGKSPAVTTADTVVVEVAVATATGIDVGSAVGLMLATVGVVETCAEG